MPANPLHSKENRQQPYAYYKTLRESAPIDCHSGQEQWTAATCEHAEYILQRPELFLSSGIPHVDTTLLGTDGPEHSYVRGVAARLLAHDRVSALEDPVRAITRSHVDAMVGSGQFNFVAKIARPAPIQTIALLLGLDPSDWRKHFRLSQAGSADATAIRSRKEQHQLEAVQRELNDFVIKHVEKCRAGKIECFFGREIVPSIEQDLAIGLTRLLFVAGTVTTQRLLGNIMIELAKDPELFGTLQSDPSLIPAMVEETLRINSPALTADRRTAKATEIGGKTIPADTRVTVLLGSANHCQHRFKNPETFDLSRGGRHLAFGHGIHFCIGAALSRMEARVLLETLVARCASIQLAQSVDDIEWDPHANLRGPLSLQLRLTARD